MRHYLNGVKRIQCDCMGCRSADKDREDKVDEIATAEEIKQKKIDELKAEIRKEIQDLDDDEIEKIKESLKAELEDLKPKDDDTEDTDTDSKSASKLERVGYDSRSIRSGSTS